MCGKPRPHRHSIPDRPALANRYTNHTVDYVGASVKFEVKLKTTLSGVNLNVETKIRIIYCKCNINIEAMLRNNFLLT